ncbi:hypothetical protein PENCOP_c003G00088 [Penicillium coprophilum]|uniref:Xylanolytic transcriptional activator regulatory domain-containing protein n=1 Tax=Penicillium coprophilum TaxID=36646 RepID=A0A1V6UWU6_9EURO|nr:hypothetical protein PENCOP_c003G00088 [Penicillium coprophilum]
MEQSSRPTTRRRAVKSCDRCRRQKLKVFNEAETGRSLTSGVLPGDTGISGATRSAWRLKELQIPPDELMWAAIDAYFSRTHWLLGLVHEPSFRANAKRTLVSGTWERQEMGNVLLLLTVAALGLKAAIADSLWPGQAILSFLGLNGCDLMKSFVSEIRLHLLDLMEDSSVESVQVCMLLSSLYGYHGSPSLAWTLARMAINAATYLELNKNIPGEEDTVLAHVRQHVWNNIIILDTYISILYGRSVSTDAAFVRPSTICDREELRIDSVILNIPAIKEICDTSSTSSFYAAQFRLYGLIRSNISRSMQIRSGSDSEIDRFEAAARCATESEILLRQWYKETPSMFRWSTWMQDNRWENVNQSLRNLSPKLQEASNIMILQAASLQITYDNALILVHRPLLQYSVNTATWSSSMATSVQTSLHVAVEAASRISRFPVHLFQNHYSLSFINFHLFTAGVILCLVPPAKPFSQTAQEAKVGVLRIIRACRAMRDKDRAAKATEEILVELLKVTTTRETRIALGTSEHHERTDSLAYASARDPVDRSGRAAPRSRLPNIENVINSHTENSSIELPLTARQTNMSGQHYPNALIDEPPRLDTNLAPFEPERPLQAQALQQSDETFGSHGKCKNLLMV